MTADEAVALGFADRVSDDVVEIAATFTYDPERIPERVRERVMAVLAPPVKPAPAKPKASVTKEPKPMTTDKVTTPDPPAEQPASLKQLKALDGADAEFCVEQLEREATLTEAVAALNAKLIADLTAARADLEKARQQPAATAPVTTPEGPVPGNDPVTTDNPQDGPSFKDPESTLQEEMLKWRNKGKNPFDALVRAYETTTGLWDAMGGTPPPKPKA